MDEAGRFDYLKLQPPDPVVIQDPQNILEPIIKSIAEITTNVNGLRLVRYLPRTSTVWYPGNDSLVGNLTNGDPRYVDNPWSVPFGTFDEFCFSTANFAKWLYCTKDAVSGAIYSNVARPIITSSSSPFPYMARWYNRGQATLEDPWVSLVIGIINWEDKETVGVQVVGHLDILYIMILIKQGLEQQVKVIEEVLVYSIS